MQPTHLTESDHFEILSELADFWTESAESLLPYHHILFPRYFSRSSFIIREDQKIVSYLYALHNSDKVYLHLIATRMGYYRKGYARTLVEQLRQSFRNLPVETYCLNNNRLGITFFEECGFTPLDTKEIRPGTFVRFFSKKPPEKSSLT